MHTKAVREIFVFSWSNNNDILNVRHGNTSSRLFSVSKTYSVDILNKLNIPILTTINNLQISLVLDDVFLRLAREAVKEKEARDNKPKKFGDLLKQKRQDIVSEFKLPSMQFSKIENIKKDYLVNLIDILRDYIFYNNTNRDEKIRSVLQYVDSIGGDVGNGVLISNNNEVSINSYKKARNIDFKIPKEKLLTE